jgi:aromatic-L-amino-acid decarboxylase
MSKDKNFHMTPGKFRLHGKQVVDWIADYYEKVETLPVLSRVQPGDIRSNLSPQPPLTGESFENILQDVSNIILPGITHWQSPNFFAFFPANTSGAAILGELLSAGLGVQGMLWATSPACTELETHVLDWLVDLLDLPENFKSTNSGGGVIQDSASSATLCAMIAAREKTTHYSSNKRGCNGELVVYTSTQGHSSIEKAAKIAGIGSENVRFIPVTTNFSMNSKALNAQIHLDRKNGKIPFFVCATVGTTSSNAMDPLPEIGRICKTENLWLHVDAAMSGTAAICPEFRYIHQGLECADSYCFNPHKWMFTNFDCDCFFVKDRGDIISALSILPEYLRNKASESGQVFDYRDWQIPLGRRFRALKLWFVIRYYGIQGLQYHVRKHVEIAQMFANWIRDHSQFELLVDPPLNLVCFRHKAGNEFNKRLVEELNKYGKIYLSHTVLNEQFVIRLSVGQTHTQLSHVEHAWRVICESAERLLA